MTPDPKPTDEQVAKLKERYSEALARVLERDEKINQLTAKNLALAAEVERCKRAVQESLDYVQSTGPEAPDDLETVARIEQLTGRLNQFLSTPNPGAALVEEWKRNREQYRILLGIFRHVHVNNGVDDFCKECGLDLRNEIHVRLAIYAAAREGTK